MRRRVREKNGKKVFGKWRLSADLSDSNAEKMKKIMKNTTLTESGVINKLIEKSKIPSSYPLAPTHKEINSFRLELNKIGVNINQIVKLANSQKELSDKLIKYYLSEIRVLLEQVEKISVNVEDITQKILEEILESGS